MSQVTLLVVLDGFGHSDSSENNAIAAANTPNWDRFRAAHPYALVDGSGPAVGLPEGQMGNSEVGHMNLGAGRVVYQDFTRINRAIEQGEFAQNRVINDAIDRVLASGSALHVMGLLSPGGVHSHQTQIFAMLRLAAERGVRRLYLHAMLDGRDTPPQSAADSLAAADALFDSLGCGRLASLCGRFYAMDRDQRWDRVEQAYRLIVDGDAPHHAASAAAGLAQAYERGETDEFVAPTTVHAAGGEPARLNDGDAVVFMNFRADRAREITRALTEAEFDGFERPRVVQLADYVTLTRYAGDIDAHVAFDTADLPNTFGEYLARCGKRQLRIAETEKYAHVTFFFSGGREDPFEGEERVLVPSPRVATYDLQPEMSAIEVTDRLVEAIASERFDAIVCNYANGDMVGHTGVFPAAVAAVETLDVCLGRLADAIDTVGGDMLITADHGNVEKMQDADTGQPHTAHTCEPVPLVYYGPRQLDLVSGGTLSDIAPSLLALMGLPQPPEMTGRSLVRLASEPVNQSA